MRVDECSNGPDIECSANADCAEYESCVRMTGIDIEGGRCALSSYCSYSSGGWASSLVWGEDRLSVKSIDCFDGQKVDMDIDERGWRSYSSGRLTLMWQGMRCSAPGAEIVKPDDGTDTFVPYF
jgi:hypothetical protein